MSKTCKTLVADGYHIQKVFPLHGGRLLQAAVHLMECENILFEILNSDMAQREEDEGNKNPLLEKARDLLEK